MGVICFAQDINYEFFPKIDISIHTGIQRDLVPKKQKGEKAEKIEVRSF